MITAETSVDIGTLITRVPHLRGGRPIIAGTGVSVRRIALLHKSGNTPQEIADNWGYLSLAQVYAALTYYYANRDEIEADLAAEAVEAERLEREYFQKAPAGNGQ